MKTFITFASLIAVALIAGCGGAELLNAPEINTVIMGETSVTVVWTVDTTIENSTDFNGYNVYVATDSTTLLVESAEDLSAFNATPITTNSYEITPLAQDSVYYIQVRTLNTDDKAGDYNATKPFVTASPRPEFTVTVTLELAPGNMNEPGCGLTFATGALVDETNDEFPGADVFFERFIQGGEETLQVNSASRRPNGRTTLMHSYGQMELDSLSELTPGDLIDDHVPFIVGDLIGFVTEEENYVKLHVDAYDSTGATVDVTYAYQDNAGVPILIAK
ncbi:MAG TPA: fibronectin type III domain-containing protein [bacterium]